MDSMFLYPWIMVVKGSVDFIQMMQLPEFLKKNLWSKTTKFFDKGKAVLVNRGLLTLFKKVTLYWKIQKMLGLKLVNFMGKGIEFLPQTKKI